LFDSQSYTLRRSHSVSNVTIENGVLWLCKTIIHSSANLNIIERIVKLSENLSFKSAKIVADKLIEEVLFNEDNIPHDADYDSEHIVERYRYAIEVLNALIPLLDHVDNQVVIDRTALGLSFVFSNRCYGNSYSEGLEILKIINGFLDEHHISWDIASEIIIDMESVVGREVPSEGSLILVSPFVSEVEQLIARLDRISRGLLF